MKMAYVFCLALLLLLGCAQQAPQGNNTACTEEAKICPDGSAVGRVGPDCEFAPCPQLVGNDSDEHGCKASAGYSWCETLRECVREWETPCPADDANASATAEAGSGILYTVKTANSSLGEILVEAAGYTLYTFAPDTEGISTCYGTCRENWPPLPVVDTITIPKGLPGGMGAFMRTDGTIQASYNGMPLYTYAGDASPGDINGEGISGKWHVAKPAD